MACHRSALGIGYVASLLITVLGGAVLALVVAVAAREVIGRLDRAAAIREIPELAKARWRRRSFWG